jgi:hypothetical protein
VSERYAGRSGVLTSEPPPLRKVTADVLTDLGWLAGTFNVPTHQSLVDFLAPGVQVIKFTRVRLPQTSDLIPFVALRREAVMLVEPTLNDELIETPGSIGRTTPRDVVCLLTAGQVRGTLEVLVNVRVSDFLRQQANLIVLRRCVFAPHGEPEESPKARRLGTVIVNLSTAVGVAERDWPE